MTRKPTYIVKTIHDSVLKQPSSPDGLPLPSGDLLPSQKIEFPNGQELSALAVSPDVVKGHIKITFDFGSLEKSPFPVAKILKATNRNTWYAYAKHVEVLGTEPKNNPKDKVAVQLNANVSDAGPLGFEFALPGNKSSFYMNREVVDGSRIIWAEALHYNQKTNYYRPPEGVHIVDKIVSTTKFIRDYVRPTIAKHYGTSTDKVMIRVNSFYRDPITNRAVGGASRSRHQAGDGMDFTVVVSGREIPPPEINRIIESVMQRNGLASSSVFTHIDLRGYFARWSYGY